MNTPETCELIRRAAQMFRYGESEEEIAAMLFSETFDSGNKFLILTAARLLAKD